MDSDSASGTTTTHADARKRPMSPKAKHRFRYWRRELRKSGIHLDRIALRNGIQYQLSGRVRATTFHPGRYLPNGSYWRVIE